MHNAFISLGGNLGDVPATMAAARARLGCIPGVIRTSFSGLYRTEPWGDKSQPWFYNAAGHLCLEEGIRPKDLLRQLHAVEESLGRIRNPARRFGPRTIDLDLLLFDTCISQGEVQLPHPRMHLRAFVLLPLLDLAPGLRFPDGRLVKEALEQLSYTQQGDTVFQAD